MKTKLFYLGTAAVEASDCHKAKLKIPDPETH